MNDFIGLVKEVKLTPAIDDTVRIVITLYNPLKRSTAVYKRLGIPSDDLRNELQYSSIIGQPVIIKEYQNKLLRIYTLEHEILFEAFI